MKEVKNYSLVMLALVLAGPGSFNCQALAQDSQSPLNAQAPDLFSAPISRPAPQSNSGFVPFEKLKPGGFYISPADNPGSNNSNTSNSNYSSSTNSGYQGQKQSPTGQYRQAGQAGGQTSSQGQFSSGKVPNSALARSGKIYAPSANFKKRYPNGGTYYTAHVEYDEPGTALQGKSLSPEGVNKQGASLSGNVADSGNISANAQPGKKTLTLEGGVSMDVPRTPEEVAGYLQKMRSIMENYQNVAMQSLMGNGNRVNLAGVGNAANQTQALIQQINQITPPTELKREHTQLAAMLGTVGNYLANPSQAGGNPMQAMMVVGPLIQRVLASMEDYHAGVKDVMAYYQLGQEYDPMGGGTDEQKQNTAGALQDLSGSMMNGTLMGGMGGGSNQGGSQGSNAGGMGGLGALMGGMGGMMGNMGSMMGGAPGGGNNSGGSSGMPAGMPDMGSLGSLLGGMGGMMGGGATGGGQSAAGGGMPAGIGDAIGSMTKNLGALQGLLNQSNGGAGNSGGAPAGMPSGGNLGDMLKNLQGIGGSGDTSGLDLNSLGK